MMVIIDVSKFSDHAGMFVSCSPPLSLMGCLFWLCGPVGLLKLSTKWLRLALVTILNGKMDGFLCLIGLLCSSFVAINRATNRRFPFQPLGNESIPSVRQGNELTSRSLGIMGSTNSACKCFGN